VVLLTAATAAAAAEVADARVVFALYSSRPWATRTRVDRNRGVNTAQRGKAFETTDTSQRLGEGDLSKNLCM
jgi:hypothetical protein